MAGLPVHTGKVGNQFEMSDLTWRIKKADLDDILTVAWGALNGEGEDILGNLPLIPKITNPNTIPYQDSSGKSVYSFARTMENTSNYTFQEIAH